MPAPDLKPQVPGEPLTDAAADPQAAKRAELEAIAALNAPEVIDGLATMTGEELALLREIEAGGKGRVTVLGAIDAALAPPKAAAGRDQAHADVSPELSVVVAGALFDFLGFLTSRDQVITAGASEDPSAVKEAVEEWAAARGLQLDEPAVADWQERGTELTSLQVGDQAAGAAGAAGVRSGAGDPQPRRAVLTDQGWVVPAPEAKG
ncbi:hypothetical protein [Stenotrophomonas sp. BIGb0135]|uniref:hypothetical protein n=1 Tax=Stenotrophomonas sp. BIGb0135 TaxID=2940620 RepID=UPI002167781F|nr:hypothetical protein [Stenotrophomonas sp. BIGb0135]MCS4235054.1 hypothetical protein [Stenotrophomonas sp. BIGb0135]MCS4235109.1 hypothetical protein [Stenotrophomonas sp. BIGb0135]